MKYKVAVMGYDVIIVEASSEKDAGDQIFEQGLNNLYNLEVLEVVKAGREFKSYTDLN